MMTLLKVGASKFSLRVYPKTFNLDIEATARALEFKLGEGLFIHYNYSGDF